MNLKLLISAAICSALVAGCSSSSSSGSEVNDLEKINQVLETNADIAYAAYSDAVTTAIALQTAIDTLATDQDQSALDAAKTAWLVAREPYGQTEVYRFRSSPIDDDPTTTAAEDGPEGAINAWPLGEALIDYVVVSTGTSDDFETDQIGTDHTVATVTDPMDESAADTDATDNIIGNTGITLDAALLANSEAGDGHDVISGYHAIEFLLWGQDLNNSGAVTTGAGDRNQAVKVHDAMNLANGGLRPVTDFQTDTNCTSGTVNNGVGTLCQRRLDYLVLVIDQLVADLTAVRDQWAPNVSGNYRASFTNASTLAEAKSRLLEILTGMGTLAEGELAGERMQIALTANSQEDEHSCFSDNTHRDIWLDAEGIANAYYGVYGGYDSDLDGTDDTGTTVNGYGIDDYLSEINQSNVADAVEAELDDVAAGYTAIDTAARNGSPFDVLIENINAPAADPVKTTILELNALSTQIASIATELGLGNASDVVDPDASACDTSNPNSSC